MEPLMTEKQLAARCQSARGVGQAVAERLTELGNLTHVDPLAIWEEALGIRHLTDDTVNILKTAGANIADAIPQLIDLAAVAIRLTHKLATLTQEQN